MKGISSFTLHILEKANKFNIGHVFVSHRKHLGNRKMDIEASFPLDRLDEFKTELTKRGYKRTKGVFEWLQWYELECDKEVGEVDLLQITSGEKPQEKPVNPHATLHDIPQMTRAYYSVDVMWNDLEYTLQRYMQHYRLELNPEFQRGHVWTDRQRTAYVEYILRGGVSGKNVYFNYPNWMSGEAKTNPDYKMVLVDGLQRITAVNMFLNNELPILGGFYREDYQGNCPLHATFTFYVNNLTNYADILQWYVDFNEGGTVHAGSEIDRVKEMIKLEKGKTA